MGRIKGTKDKYKRKRSQKSEQAKKATATAKMRDMGIPSVSSFFRRTQDSEEKSEEDSHDQIPHVHVDDVVTVNDAATFNDKEIEDIDPPGVFANLFSEEEELTEIDEDELIDDDEYDACNYDDDGDNELSEHSRKVPAGVQQRYVWAVHERIKMELSRNFNGLETPWSWLLNHLKENDWWIRREHALRISIKLSLPKEHLAYY